MPKSFHASVAALILLGGGLACHSEKTPEDEVRQSLEDAVAAINAGNAAKAVDCLDGSFQGPEGMDKGAAQLYLAGLLKQGPLSVKILSQSVAFKGEMAYQKATVLGLQQGSSLLPKDGSKEDYFLRWVRKDGRWRLVELQQVAVGNPGWVPPPDHS